MKGKIDERKIKKGVMKTEKLNKRKEKIDEEKVEEKKGSMINFYRHVNFLVRKE